MNRTPSPSFTTKLIAEVDHIEGALHFKRKCPFCPDSLIEAKVEDRQLILTSKCRHLQPKPEGRGEVLYFVFGRD